MHVLGVNAVFHDPAAALVSAGRIAAAAEEERFTRRKHGKRAVPFSTWELPEEAMRWCLRRGGLRPEELDAIAYSYDPALAPDGGDVTADAWEPLRTLYARRAPSFLATALPGVDPARVVHVPHHVAHAASAYLAAGWENCAVLVCDGRGERSSMLAGWVRDGRLDVLATQALPHSLGLLYSRLTEHLGFRRDSDEYKVMAMASYGTPSRLAALRELVRADGAGGFRVDPALDLARWAPPLARGDDWRPEHADLAASVQARLEEVLLDLLGWLRRETGEARLAMAGGVALNCVANTRLLREGPFDELFVQPAAGDAGTALGAALWVARDRGEPIEPMGTADLGRSWSDDEVLARLRAAGIEPDRPEDAAETAAEILAEDGIVAWFQGRSEFGPRALGHRSLLANPCHEANLERLNDVKGREQFRPVAPMVTLERARDVFCDGPIPSPYMLFTHGVREAWRTRIPAVVHVDGSARAQTVDRIEEPRMAAVLDAFERRTGVPVLVNTSLNTAGRPMVDDPRDALECLGSAPIDALVIGPYVVRRTVARRRRRSAATEAVAP
jgi:carbamoyltransferase